jgi:hypothetical protein
MNSAKIPGGPGSAGRKQATGGKPRRAPKDTRPQTKGPGAVIKRNGGAAGKAPRNHKPGH